MIRGNIQRVPDSTLEIINQILTPHNVKITKEKEDQAARTMAETAVSVMRKADVCKKYHVSAKYLYELIKAGKLKAAKMGNTKQAPVYIEVASLNSYFTKGA